MKSIYLPLLIALVLSGCEKKPAMPAATPSIVSVVQVKQGELKQAISALGQAQAPQTVEVRPQINAQIAQIHFKEGEMVQAGQVLFTLDAREIASQARREQALIAQSQAQLAEAVRNLQRTEELALANFVSSSAVDTARAKADSLRAQVAAKQADLALNRVELSYRSIKAPIAGRTGAVTIKQGSLAQTSNSEPLVTISQVDPIDVSFKVNQRDLPALLAAKQQIKVSARLPDGQQRAGKWLFVDNKVEQGTLIAKAQFSNADRQLWPGLSSTVDIELAPQQGLIVPLQAIQTGQEQRFVYVIKPDQQVQIQPVRLISSNHDTALIDGVAAGTLIVLEGGQNLRPGKQGQVASRPTSSTKP